MGKDFSFIAPGATRIRIRFQAGGDGVQSPRHLTDRRDCGFHAFQNRRKPRLHLHQVGLRGSDEHLKIATKPIRPITLCWAVAGFAASANNWLMLFRFRLAIIIPLSIRGVFGFSDSQFGPLYRVTSSCYNRLNACH